MYELMSRTDWVKENQRFSKGTAACLGQLFELRSAAWGLALLPASRCPVDSLFAFEEPDRRVGSLCFVFRGGVHATPAGPYLDEMVAISRRRLTLLIQRYGSDGTLETATECLAHGEVSFDLATSEDADLHIACVQALNLCRVIAAQELAIQPFDQLPLDQKVAYTNGVRDLCGDKAVMTCDVVHFGDVVRSSAGQLWQRINVFLPGFQSGHVVVAHSQLYRDAACEKLLFPTMYGQ